MKKTAFLFLALFSSWAPAWGAPPPAAPSAVEDDRLLPPDTAVVVRLSRGPASSAVGIEKLARDPAMAPLAEFLRTHVKPLAELARWLDESGGALTLAAFPALLESQGRLPDKGLGVVLADVSKGGVFAERVEEWIARFRAEAKEAGLELEASRKDGFEILTRGGIVPPQETKGEGGLPARLRAVRTSLARGQGRVLLGPAKDVEDCLDRLRGAGECLAYTASYREALEAVGKGEGLFAHVADLSWLWRRMDSRPGGQERLEASGLAGLASVSLSVRPSEGLWHTTLRLATPGARAGILKLLDQPAIGEGPLRYVPASPLAFACLSLDVPESWERLLVAMEGMGAEQAGQAKRARSAQAALDMLLKIGTKEWASALGPRAAFYLGGVMPPSGCLLVQKGPSFEEVERTVRGIQERLPDSQHPWKQMEHAGRTLQYQPAEPLQPGYVVDGDWVLFGPVLELKEALARFDKGGGRFEAPKGMDLDQAVLRIDWPALAGLLPLLGEPLRQAGFDPAGLPDAGTVAARLAPTEIEARASSDGWVLRERSPCPVALTLLIAAMGR